MKVGDRLPVQIEGVDVAEAIVDDIEDGNATLVIPATRLVVKIRQSLDLAATKEPEVDRIFTGTEEPKEEPQATPQIGGTYGSDVGEGIHGRTLDSSALDD